MAKGHIQTLPSGAHRAAVYLGTDPLTKKRVYLWGKSTRDYQKAVADLADLLAQAEQEQQADTKATVGFLVDRYLQVAEIGPTTRPSYEGYVRRTLKPALGDVQIRRVRASTLEQLYARLRVCSELCDGRLAGKKVTQIRRWRDREKEVVVAHHCHPMAAGTLRQLNAILSGAFQMAIRWEWINRNPARQAKLPRVVRHEPEPPEPEEIGRLLDHAWEVNPALAVFIWLAVVSGSRRGELCGWRWTRFDLEEADPSMTVARSYAVVNGERIEKDTKTHAKRRMAMDEITRVLVVEHRERCQAFYTAAGLEMPPDGFVFSNDGGVTAWNPDWVTHQIQELAQAAGVRTNIREMRHYNATQLLSNGVDLRTTAARLGHSGGGAVTMRVYAHRTRTSDRKAAQVIAGGLSRPGPVITSGGRSVKPVEQILLKPTELPKDEAPFRRIAADLRVAIDAGRLTAGDLLPTITELADWYGVGPSTAQRAVRHLADHGTVVLQRGARTRVVSR